MKTTFVSILLIFSIFQWRNAQAQSHSHHAGCQKHRLQLKELLTDPANMRSDTLDVLNYQIELDMTQMSAQIIAGICRVDFKSKMDGISLINLDLLDLTVDSVKHDDNNLDFIQENPLLTVHLPVVLNENDEYNVSVYYHGDPATDPTWGGFYFSSGYGYNLGVGFDADPHNFGRVWFPCFDNFVEKSRYEINVLTQNSKTAYCNGLLMSVDTVGTDSLYSSWVLDEEIPSYLASVSVGDYVRSEQNFENILGEDVPVWLVAKAVDTLDMKQSMVNLIPWLHGLEESYGLHRFPRVGFCAVPFNGGAMEHATNISYPLFAIDGSLAYETLYAHEIAHHWWGDNITCRTAGDMWINEGWASYSEALFMEKIYGFDEYIDYVRDNHKDVLLHAHISDNGRYPVSPVPHEITYGSHVYNKGADVAHTLRGYMGDNDFFIGIQAMMEEYAYDDIDSEEMRDFLQAYTDADLTSYFDNWIFDTGFPEFRISSFDMQGGNLNIEQQGHYNTALYENVPLAITVLGTNDERYDTTVVVSGELTSLQLGFDFDAWAAYLNDSSAISQAVLGENKWLDHNGNNDFNYAEMDLDVSNLVEGDSVWMRSENHWATAHSPAFIPGTDIFISPDRWWSVIVSDETTSQFEARFPYQGNPGSNNYFDPIFFEYLEANGYTENDLVLMYRPLYSTIWTEYQGEYAVNTQGGETNWTGRIEVPGLGSGDYTWAIHTGVISVNESPRDQTLQVFFNTTGELQVTTSAPAQIEIFDTLGKRIIQFENQFTSTKTFNGAPGIYFVKWSMNDNTGQMQILKPN